AKGPLLLAGVWLGWRRAWIAAVVTFVGFGAWNLLPETVYPADSGKLWMTTWVEQIAAPATSSGMVAEQEGIWRKFNEQNQSLAAAVTRSFAPGRGEDVIAALVELPGGVVKFIGPGLALLLLGFAFWSLRPLRTWSDFSTTTPRSVFVAREMGIVALLSLLLSPMTSMAHFCVVSLAVLALLRDAHLLRNKGVWALASIGLLVGLLGKDIVGREVGTHLRFYGQGTLACVFLLLALSRSSGLQTSKR
ncbi:MAG: hypothetical protein AAF517_26375, partial [Planctomycetota bacterium]